jgi:hypothetical protein
MAASGLIRNILVILSIGLFFGVSMFPSIGISVVLPNSTTYHNIDINEIGRAHV